MLRIFIAGAHGFHRAKTADADGHNGRLGAAGKHHHGVAHFDRAPGFADGVVGGCARGDGGVIRPAQIVKHREQTGGHVADEHGNHERRHPARPAFEQDFVLRRRSFESADARPNDDADFVAIELVEVGLAVL